MSEIERILNAKEKKVEQKSLISSFFKKIKKFLGINFPKLYKIKIELKKKKYVFRLGNEYTGNVSSMEQSKLS